MRRAVALLLALVLGALVTRQAGAQQAPAYRFEVAAISDTTFSFVVGDDTAWVRVGMHGIAVDPRKRDALVARFRVLSVAGGSVTALVTGQTTAVSTDDIALLERPPVRGPHWFQRPSFWVGLIIGGAGGALAAHHH